LWKVSQSRHIRHTRDTCLCRAESESLMEKWGKIQSRKTGKLSLRLITGLTTGFRRGPFRPALVRRAVRSIQRLVRGLFDSSRRGEERRRTCGAVTLMSTEEHKTGKSRRRCCTRGYERACNPCITHAPSQGICNVWYPAQSTSGVAPVQTASADIRCQLKGEYLTAKRTRWAFLWLLVQN
jgi:hypothetical protein